MTAIDRTVHIPRTIVTQLLDQARTSPNAEVCGLISSKTGTPARCYSVTNIAAVPACRYEMDPKQLIDAMREMRNRGEDLFAIYHSHPASPAHPSLTDLREAGYPEAIYLIVSLETPGVLEMRGYYLRNGTPEEIPLAL